MKDLTQGFGDQTPATDDGVSRHQHSGADALSTGGSYWVGHLGKEAIAAVGVAGKLQRKFLFPKNFQEGIAEPDGIVAS
jgi:hypothetical protein